MAEALVDISVGIGRLDNAERFEREAGGTDAMLELTDIGVGFVRPEATAVLGLESIGA